VLEHPYVGAAQSRTKTNRCMIQLVGDDETAFGDERWYDRGICCKTHRRNESVFLSNETGNQRFSGHVQLRRTPFEAGAAAGDSITTKALLDGVSTPTLSLRKAKVVIGRNVETTGLRPRRGSVAVIFSAMEERDRSSRDTSNWREKTVIQTYLKPSGVEGVEIRIKSGITLLRGRT
jgi:hypothetical protein